MPEHSINRKYFEIVQSTIEREGGRMKSKLIGFITVGTV